MMAASLPPFPRLVFTVLEPLSLVAGFAGAVYDPAWFVAQQIPQDKPVAASENSIVMAHQLGNMYLAMCFVGLALFRTTSEARVVRSYLVALLLADAGHVGFTWYGMGTNRFMDVSGWNAMAWGNLGATLFLAFTRIAYLSGMFGPDRHGPAAITMQQKKKSK
ncbi:uncharacterized protein TRIREDRAFT_55041 [Trichoderma reesei QM6a]|uniref:Predicted protein n=2 Tax=Hypocrea jecorina TaxID=51453 RepID=G0RAH0_HYPJQ|nr:uncharacterized protein TRIREDRAFT_55041 [Trichoderma reesei QM6a]EGR51594.1 predicted protein [Trichoderma reesei QM6a]ETR96915.1 hypothetical protein M419DRAFT_92939 [Trichoderma reesei RUT C-30]